MYLNISSELSKLRETLCGPANANNTEQLQCKYCPRNWVLHQQKCYSFSEEKRSWNDSAEYCKLQMARLAVLSSEEKVRGGWRCTCSAIKSEVGIFQGKGFP
ncbi:C-type lectin domain family 10 member A-like [Alligator mississippiensis]|uniref:C-type lectin domain family 10 member A-like n=1 Tax=Alligator mississippiensis TaxID=8496 RepID=UPI002877B4E0|nr:C-type lectin domain family 10 member A-like [Alligator mississippiensis]